MSHTQDLLKEASGEIKNYLQKQLNKIYIDKDRIYFAQLFIDAGKGFSEEESIKLQYGKCYEKNLGIIEINFDLSSFENIYSIRFDPLNGPVIIRISSVQVTLDNGNILAAEFKQINRSYNDINADYFFHDDPIYLIKIDKFKKVKKINIVVNYLSTVKDISVLHEQTQDKSYTLFGKLSSLETLIEFIQEAQKLDWLYKILSDNSSKETFDWFIKYRFAYLVLQEDAYSIFPPKLTRLDFAKAENNVQKLSENEYKIKDLLYSGAIGEAIGDFYFNKYIYQDIVKPNSNDIILDIGAYAGDTALYFSQYIDEKGMIFAFEPFEENYNLLTKNIKLNKLEKKIIPIKKGIGHSNESSTMIGSSAGAFIDYETNTGFKIDMITIDKFVEDYNINRVSFIKMDIEGSELEAIKGANDTIKKFAPQLAISIYHKGNDIIDIPEYLLSIDNQYKFYLKHISTSWVDTVLYAYCIK
ncbi:MAG: FkbM family methyltransferase [Candidatus Acididesulfobacter diazotrophicus]|jgi:FkbM family methyltransferase|uniref:FkbM family methyltransferase n=1 Tax=Candidatus Acididesulfobacter diazotrophicus TaxID=2597226 RepID=A0A519BPW3_9DELT|nr:MAG: FkbM family methyltransferase [Candidatus Acididesulfobacter diazotrophicus]